MAGESSNANKQVGSLYLDLQLLKANVDQANKLLSTIGKDIKQDFSQSITKQIKESVEKATKEIGSISLPISTSSSSTRTRPSSTSDRAVEREALRNLNSQLRIRNQIHKIDKLLISAKGDEADRLEEIKAQSQAHLLTYERQYNLLERNNSTLSDSLSISAKQTQIQATTIANETALEKERKKQQDILRQQSETYKTIERTVVAMLAVYTTRALTNFWNEAHTYATTYYDQLNEIRIVTKATEEEAAQMGKTYRQIAKDMKVSSTDVASAAVEFWRQGQSESDVNIRVKNTTQYAKIAKLEFQDAAEQVTAATNSMNLDAQRVVDVFSYLGDASAAGADEIGTAMQKAAATADEAGVSFEWLGAYIATVSEKTRQAPESIGNAFNSIMSRLQSIKQMGYNEEDETKINDVAKALNAVNIELMGQDGEWRSMSDIFMDVALQWGEMDDKARAYLATTMAGTRQKNVFLTLMNDMAKVSSTTGEASRAMELYYGALNSAGAASEKYAIYQQSVEAAQANMNVAFEEFYSLLSANIIKEYYNTMADLVSMITDGTNAITVMTGAVGGLAIALTALGSLYAKMKATDDKLSLISFITKPKIVATLGAVAAGVIAVTAAFGAFKQASSDSDYDYTGVLESINNRITNTTALRDEYEALAKVENRSVQQNERMKSIVDTLATSNDRLNESLGRVNGGWENTQGILAAINAEIETYKKSARDIANSQFLQSMSSGADIVRAQQSYNSAGAKGVMRDYLLGWQGQKKGFLAGGGTWDLYNEKDIQHIVKTFAHHEQGDYQQLGLDYADVKAILDEYGNDYVSMVEDLINGLSSSERNAGLQEAWKSFILSCFTPLSYDDTYTGLSTAMQQQLQEVALGFLDNFSIEDLADPSKRYTIQNQIVEYINSLLTGDFGGLSKMISQYMENLETYDPKNADHVSAMEASKNAINELIKSFNTSYGTNIPLLDTLVAIQKTAESTGDETKTLEEQVRSLYKSLSEDVLNNAIAARSDSGWDKEIKSITEALESGDIERIEKMAHAFASEENAPWLEQMKTDLPFIANVLHTLYDDSGALVPDPVNIEEALRIWYEGLDETEKKAIAVGEALKNSLASQELEALTESGFASWFEEMSKFAETGDEAGLYGWLLGKDDEQLKAFIEAFPIFSEFLNSIIEGKGAVDESSESWALFSENISNATNKYLEWLEAYKASQESEVTDEEGRGLLKSLSSAYDKDGIKGYKKEFESMTDAQRNWIVKNSEAGKQMVEIMEDNTDATKDGTSAMKKMNREIGRMDLDDLVDAGDVWEDIPDMLDAAAKGGKDFSDAYSDAVGEVEKLSEAQGALTAIQNGTLKSADDLDDAYSTLASYTGLSADSLRNDLSPALWMINNDTAQASNSVAYLANWLANAAGVQFTASNWQSQLAALMGSADETTAHVATLVNTMLKAAGSSLYMSGNTVKVKWGGGSFTPASVRSGGGGRSGGGSGSSGSSSSNEMSEIEKMLDLMKQIQDIRDHQMDLIQEARSYYETTGELQGVIKYYEKERDAILDNNQVLEDNIAKIESLMFAKQKEVASMSTSDDAYEQAAKDLEGLQEAHQEYTQQLLENRTAVEELTQSIKEQQDEIRDMEIELRETIMDAIKDREELNERMLQGTIDVENEILDVIKRRYEKERDEIIETAEAKREALEEEMDLLDEQLEVRKKAADQEDKQLKLTQLQAKLERISADPTRKKEELELRKEIADLRDEMAWDLAEQEVEAQKDSIDQQINSLDEYIEYVENYYEELFNHPQKQIEEMKSIISKTDEEILAFLQQNSEEYAASTEAAQQDMINSWNAMLMDMHGSIEDYWDEVEQIIAGGDDAIIEFLKQNSADYKAAGKLQAEAYVDEWKQQLEDLRKAHKEITEEINNTTYTVVKPSTGSSSSNSGGSSGAGPSNSKPTAPQWYLTINGKKTGNPVSTESEAARMAYLERTYGVQSGKYKPTDIISYARYKKGGLANFTGLAWLDGTKTKPERILSAYQTELFEDLIATLHGIKVFTSSMPSVGFDGANSGQTFTFGDIVINVDSLNNDSDYETIAEQIMEQIMDMMTRGSAVGGIRITR